MEFIRGRNLKAPNTWAHPSQQLLRADLHTWTRAGRKNQKDFLFVSRDFADTCNVITKVAHNHAIPLSSDHFPVVAASSTTRFLISILKRSTVNWRPRHEENLRVLRDQVRQTLSTQILDAVSLPAIIADIFSENQHLGHVPHHFAQHPEVKAAQTMLIILTEARGTVQKQLLARIESVSPDCLRDWYSKLHSKVLAAKKTLHRARRNAEVQESLAWADGRNMSRKAMLLKKTQSHIIGAVSGNFVLPHLPALRARCRQLGADPPPNHGT